MVVVDGLHVTYRGRQTRAIQGLSCSWDSAGVVAVVGRSGVGKSTLLQCIAGIQARGLPTVSEFDGLITVDGEPPNRHRGPGVISWVPQVPTLLGHLSVIENVLLPIVTTKGRDDRDLEFARALIDQLGMRDVSHARPSQLSGGMKTRVSVARALVGSPKYLYLDEPFSSLDLANRWSMYKLIRERRADSNLSTVVTSHNIPESALIADRIVVLTCQKEQTVARVIPNKPALALGCGPGECLEAARRFAAAIESEVFLS